MSWTYGGNPGAEPRDKVRWLLGDKTQTSTSPTDEELEWLLEEENGNEYLAAAEAADSIAATLTGMAATSKKIGDLSLAYDYEGTGARWRALGERLRAKVAKPVIGIPVASAAAFTPTLFSIGMDDNNEDE